MKLKTLGSTGWQVSELSFGCMSLEKNTPAECAYLIEKAVAAGINFFDTADLYEKGANEEKAGAALKQIRKKIFIATKVGNEWRPDGSGWNWNPRKEYILTSVEKSLQRLQTDYIDLYQLHGGTIEDNIDETIEAFELLKQQGKIRHYGISSIRPNVIREYVKRSSIASVMLQYSLLDRRPEETVLSLLKENNKGVLVRGALAQGLLIDKPAKEYLGYSQKEVRQLQEAIRAFSNYTPQQLTLQYVLQNPAVTSVVAGIRTNEQLEELLAALKPVVTTVSEQLSACLKPLQYTQHRE
ncbi:oxidoreductase [Niabella ginsenosidivorans]|uniref:Oxidoreductase n=1 Tax=Niabella ginsenosidivorans TaxID=1176587 RepID=A0A1A9I7X6_9BACT|nr:aldo/keto reductase [Niabella ginsenosidivorans]ANH83149.1 oxidoreductase [Niabella ginsenosidivorans]